MMISMQGNWTVSVKLKNAGFPQRFIVQGATTGNGNHAGNLGFTVNVTGAQWSIIIQNDPGTGWQTSQTRIKFPQRIGSNYVFDIDSNDAGSDSDYDDLVLTCSTPVNINEFVIYGNVTLYSGRCIFSPCRRFPFVIETYPGLLAALKNPLLRDYLRKYYPERIPIPDIPNPPDPPYFKPIVFDITEEATKPKTVLQYTRLANDPIIRNDDVKVVKAAKGTEDAKDAKEAEVVNNQFAAANFQLTNASQLSSAALTNAIALDKLELSKSIGGLVFACNTDPGANLTLSFEEYDRTAAELSGGGYTGTGHRRLLGDTITDMNGNYIFRFRFDMTFPGLEDNSDITGTETVDTVMYPDVIVKIVDYASYRIVYESAPFYNIPNLRRINLCLPESQVSVSSACFNGNLIGSLGNVFLGGNQNDAASIAAPALRRYGNSNFLEANGKVSVNSALAGFNIECAAWAGSIDMKGCMYDAAKTAANNRIRWYTIRIRRSTIGTWTYVNQNYRHPKFSKRHLPGYIGDDVGPFYPAAGGVLNGSVPAYINIQRQIFVDGIDWEFSNLDRFIQLNTALYDVAAGVRTPGTFYVRVDGYDAAGALVPDATDLIALYIHNNGLAFNMTAPMINDPAVLNAGCGLYRLSDEQLKTPIVFSFMANDPYGFVNSYALSMGRCPGTSLNLNANIEGDFTITGGHTFPGGSNPLNVHNSCPGFTGTIADYSDPDMVDVVIQPTPTGDGWIKPGEYFTVYSFSLTATQRVTNGYNSGVSGTYYRSGQIMMERLNPE